MYDAGADSTKSITTLETQAAVPLNVGVTDAVIGLMLNLIPAEVFVVAVVAC